MTRFKNEHAEIIKSIIGESLLGINGLIYWLEEPDLIHPQQIQFTFSRAQTKISFRCGMDGSTLEFTDIEMQESDLGEYGREVIMNISYTPHFQQYLGQVLSGFFAIYSATENSIIGMKLCFKNQINLIILNTGDEISIFDSLSLQYEKEERITYIDVTI
ncbi:hypothetical protein [Serratia microhaemolytica]|uniref:hypothetical protein n=1 Tax=Serratia microhaemolytica TaxID=2675110 RepID=UPI000FDEC647|nr:hypothetical protein [Serratia microhaemolytica]